MFEVLKIYKQELYNFIQAIMFSSSHELDESQKSIIEILKKDGIYVVPNYYSDSQCDNLRAQIDKSIIDYREHIWVDDTESDFRINGFNYASEEAQQFLDDRYILDVLESYEKCKPLKYRFVDGAKVTFKEGNKGSGGGWHRDRTWGKMTKAILYLDDVSEENGPFQYVKYSHKPRSVIRYARKYGFKFDQSRFDNQFIDAIDEKTMTMTGNKGDLILVDTRGIHRGMPIESGERYALTNYYFNYNAFPKFKMIPKKG